MAEGQRERDNVHLVSTSPLPERISCFGVVIIASVAPLSTL